MKAQPLNENSREKALKSLLKDSYILSAGDDYYGNVAAEITTDYRVGFIAVRERYPDVDYYLIQRADFVGDSIMVRCGKGLEQQLFDLEEAVALLKASAE